MKDPFIYKLVDQLSEQFSDFFPEIAKNKELVKTIVKEEESSFLKTLSEGILRLDSITSNLKSNIVSGKVIFELYDTYGFPVDLTSLILKEKNLSFNENEYESELEKQKSRSRSASDMKTEDWVVINKTASSIFRGYDKVSLKTKINKYRKVFNKDNKLPESSYKEKVGDIKNDTQVSDNKKTLNNVSLLKENNFKSDQNSVDKRKDKIQISKIDNEISEMSAEANERDPSTEMVLKATGNSWVEIEDVDGNVLMTRLMRPGETYVVPKINGLTFNTGNAGALSLTQGNILVPSLGEVGEIIKARPLNIKVFGNKTILD